MFSKASRKKIPDEVIEEIRWACDEMMLVCSLDWHL
jgi:hypothetical protein